MLQLLGSNPACQCIYDVKSFYSKPPLVSFSHQRFEMIQRIRASLPLKAILCNLQRHSAFPSLYSLFASITYVEAMGRGQDPLVADERSSADKCFGLFAMTQPISKCVNQTNLEEKGLTLRERSSPRICFTSDGNFLSRHDFDMETTASDSIFRKMIL